MDVSLTCPSCGSALADDDRFCEACGARLAEPARNEGGCHACGAPADAIDIDGYCSVCGVREQPPGERLELDLTIAAAVSDQGRVHRRNEDAFHLDVLAEDRVAAVVCDGISSASSGDVAARTAAQVAGGFLSEACTDPERNAGDALFEAIDAAHAAVAEVPWTTRTDRAVPSCTLVCAMRREAEIAVGWIGDSRAYWIEPAGARQLTIDDSWAEEQISEGLMSAQEAFRDSRSHSITHWVGADAPPQPPRIVILRPESPGHLLLCTDGLWNYAPTVGELAALVQALPEGASPAAIARALTETALSRGGRDNITVAVIDVNPSEEHP
jgi:serine/threonine protein phosphatase PrpC